MLRLFGGAKSAQTGGTQPDGLESPGVDRVRVLGGWVWSDGTKGKTNKQTEVLVYCFCESSFLHAPSLTEKSQGNARHRLLKELQMRPPPSPQPPAAPKLEGMEQTR